MYAGWDLSPPLPAASLPSGCRTVVILCLRVCLVCVFLLSVYHHRFRSPSFVQATEPRRYSYLLGSFSVYPAFCHRRFRLPPFIQAVESWLYCYSSCLCALFDTHQRICDMVILRFRVLCCTLGSILSCIFGFYSDLSPPVPLVPVFTRLNYGNPRFFVAQIVFSFTTTVGFQLPFPLCKATEPLYYRPHD